MMGRAEQSFDHLRPEIRQALAWSTDRRIEQVWSDSYIPYQKAEKIISRIEGLRKRPKTIRPQNLLITGPAGNGKTAILNEYLKRHPCRESQDSKGHIRRDIRPVLLAQTPSSAGDNRILSAILKPLYPKDWDRGSTDAKMLRILNALDQCKVEILLLDEVNNMLGGGKRVWDSLRAIKSISNEFKLPIVFAGTEDASFVVRQDPQLTTRIDPVALSEWSYGQEYVNFLSLFESTIPLEKPSNLYKQEKANRILELSKGLDAFGRKGILFNIIKLLKGSAEAAISSGSEEIDPTILEKTAKELANTG